VAEEHDIRARLVLDTGQYYAALGNSLGRGAKLDSQLERIGATGKRATQGAAQGMRQLATATGVANASLGGVVGKMVALGATYFGVQAITGAVSRGTNALYAYTAAIDEAQMSVSSIIAGVVQISLNQADRVGSKVSRELRDAALLSPATSFELLDIFKGIVGPIRAAGEDMQKVLDITQQTSIVAKAFGVDFQQAGRDITMMTRGAAGVDVKLFSLLTSMRAITENAEQWNKLLPQERIEKLSAALGRFATDEVAERVGNSWGGVTSSLQDLTQELGRSAMVPILETMRVELLGLRDAWLDNRVQLEMLAEAYGVRIAGGIRAASDAVQTAFHYAVNNWDTITDRFNQGVGALRTAIPMLLTVAGVFQAFQIGTAAANLIPGGGGGIARKAAKRGGAFGADDLGDKDTRAFSKRQKADPWNQLDFGGGGGNAAGGLMAARGGFFQFGGLGTAGGEAMAAVGGAATGLAVLAGVLVAVAAAAETVKANWDVFSIIVSTSIGDIKAEGEGLWTAFKGFLGPSFELLGNITTTLLAPALQLTAAQVEWLAVVLTETFEILGGVVSFLNEGLAPAFEMLFAGFRTFGAHIDFLLEKLGVSPTDFARGGVGQAGVDATYGMNDSMKAWGRNIATGINETIMGGVPKARGGFVQNNDFRGSQFKIKQDFVQDEDPDRIVSVMMRDLTRQAEMRISTGYAPAFTR
jgi:hypothetical protein